MAKKPGRPKLSREDKRSYRVGMRITPKLREALEAAAKESGRSITQEIEDRLEATFDTVIEELLQEVTRLSNTLRKYGGKDDTVSEAWRTAMDVITIIYGTRVAAGGGDWREDFEIADKLSAVIEAYLKTRSAPRKDGQEAMNDQVRSTYGQDICNLIFDERTQD